MELRNRILKWDTENHERQVFLAMRWMSLTDPEYPTIFREFLSSILKLLLEESLLPEVIRSAV